MKKQILFFCLISLLACNKVDYVIYYNKSFEDISLLASKLNQPFCIVLTDSTQRLSNEYNIQLCDNYKILSESAIYNLVDVNLSDNEWYVKWLCPRTLPLTCVFDVDATLLDLIPGAAKETFLYSEQAIKNRELTGFHWPNSFKMNKKSVVPLLNDLLKQKEYLNSGIYIPDEINQLIDSLHYPYALYLKLVGELLMNDSVAMQETALSLLELETPFSFDSYKNEFITAKQVLNPDFDIIKEPAIRVAETILIFENCPVNKSIPVDIIIHNDGVHPLRIPKIQLSCSCLEHVTSNEDIVIEGKESYVAKFYFTPEKEGEISRDIFIPSNAINTPVLHINLLANIIPNTNN